MSASPESTGTRAESTGSLVAAVVGAFLSVRQFVADLADGFTRDLRHLGMTALALVFFAFFALVLAVTAWFSFMAAFALWLVSRGFTWIEVMSIVGAANLIAAVVVFVLSALLSRNMLFPRTRRQLAKKKK